MDLTSVYLPQLKFWHIQMDWSGRVDQLTVYYKTSAAGAWTQLATYSTLVSSWTQETISLPEVSSEFYIGFEGDAKYGRGVCLDDVEVGSACATMLPVSVSVTPSVNPVCLGSSVTFTASPVNGGATPAYQWKVNGSAVSGATNATYSYAPAGSDQVSCILTSNASCITGNPATSNTVTMSATTPSPVSISVAASANPVCVGSSVTFTATPANGGTTPRYQWKVNGSNVTGATNVSYSFIPANGTTVACILTSNLTCVSGNPATSNIITMTVNSQQPVGISISASANAVCQGREDEWIYRSEHGQLLVLQKMAVRRLILITINRFHNLHSQQQVEVGLEHPAWLAKALALLLVSCCELRLKALSHNVFSTLPGGAVPHPPRHVAP